VSRGPGILADMLRLKCVLLYTECRRHLDLPQHPS
jgi:hypothetical protein